MVATRLQLKGSSTPPYGYSPCTGEQVTNLRGNSVYDVSADWYASTGFGDGKIFDQVGTVDGPTAGVEWRDSLSQTSMGFMTGPLAADVTISGTITFNLWAFESSMSANAAINCLVYRIRGDTLARSLVAQSARTTELGTSASVGNFTATPTSTGFLKGDRILIVPYIDDAGTMGGSYTVTLDYGLGSAGADGDSYVEFTETLTFAATPSGTTIYPTTSGAGVNPGSATELLAWTSRGSGVTSSEVTGETGPTCVQFGSSTLIEWYTPQLESATLAGAILCNIRQSSTNATYSSVRAELARTDGDGTNPTVWAKWNSGSSSSESGRTIYLAASDMSISTGQRLRVRFYLDDGQGNLAPAVAGTIYYAGASGASGDTYLTFPITLTEYSAPGGDVQMPYIGGGYYP
jgi:hypothetical protein